VSVTIAVHLQPRAVLVFWYTMHRKYCDKKNVLLAFALTLLFNVAAKGQEFWDKKPYQEWSEEECRKLLAKSPWAQSQVLTEVIIQPLQASPVPRPLGNPTTDSIETARAPDPGARADVGRARQTRPELRYQAQFRSALPIRQAIVRLGQIRAKYDELNAEQKAGFDRNAATFLSKRFPDSVVLYVSYSSNVQMDDRELSQYWRTQTTDTLKNSVFLILSGGEKVPLSDYALAQGAAREFQFVFPRVYQGRPVIGDDDKTIRLEFIHPKIRDQRESRVFIEFKAEKMLVKGEAVY
jgi:hypothetical protein